MFVFLKFVRFWNITSSNRRRAELRGVKSHRQKSREMLEKQALWKREGGFDRIETIAEMHAESLKCMHAGFDPEPYYTGLYSPRRAPTPEEFSLDLKVEVESLRIEVLLLQPLPPSQYDLPPRRSPATSTGLDEPGESHPEMQQTEQEETFPFQAGVDGFLHVDCMGIPEQGETLSIQADVGGEPRNNGHYSTSRRLPGVWETADERATSRVRID